MRFFTSHISNFLFISFFSIICHFLLSIICMHINQSIAIMHQLFVLCPQHIVCLYQVLHFFFHFLIENYQFIVFTHFSLLISIIFISHQFQVTLIHDSKTTRFHASTYLSCTSFCTDLSLFFCSRSTPLRLKCVLQG